jgi:hypothetical protein
MKLFLTHFAALALTLLLGSTQVAHGQVDQEIDIVDVIKASGTVTKVDQGKRKLSVELEDGRHKIIKVDKSIRNFDQIQVGDKLKLAYTEEILIAVGKSDAPTGADSAGIVAIAPKGSKPGGLIVGTTIMTGKIVALDPAKHHLTIQEPDGKHKKLKISKKATNLDTLKPGETIGITITEALAISIEN